MPALIYLALASWGLEEPGIQYDEVLWGNAALGVQDHSFIAWSWQVGDKQLPIMLMPYIGALKAYLYFPILRLFEPSPLSLRLPMILVSGVALCIFVLTARRALGRWGVLIFGLLVATDPSYLFHTRMDWGPVAIMMLLKALSAYLFIRWWETRRLLFLAMSGLCLGAGVFDKVNFLWFVLAAGFAVVVAYGRELRKRLSFSQLTCFSFAFLLGALPVLLYNVAFPLVTIREPFELPGSFDWARVLSRLEVGVSTLLGTAVYSFVDGGDVAGDVSRFWDVHVPGAISADASVGTFVAALLTTSPLGRGSLLGAGLLVALVVLLVHLWRAGAQKSRAGLAGILALAVMALEILITPRAGGSHHMMMLYPLPQFLVVLAGTLLIRDGKYLARGLRSAWTRAATTLVVALLLLSNIAVSLGYLHYFSTEGGKDYWSSAIYQLVDYGKARPESRLVLMDWGFNTQLLTLSRGSIRKDEVFHWLNEGQAERDRFQAYLDDPNSIYVFHAPEFTKVPKAREIFQLLLRENGLREEVDTTFHQRTGEPIIYVSRAVAARP